MANVALVLSGCGYLDGSEIYETVLTIVALEKNGLKWQGIASNKNQNDVINHLNKSINNKAYPRNILEESARITRGNIIDIAQADSNDYDAVIFPGGFGITKNIINFDFVNNESFKIDKDILNFAKEFYLANKPAGYICIAPLIIPLIYPAGTKATVGTDYNISAILEKYGAKAVIMDATNICIDDNVKVISTAAYMCSRNILEVSKGIEKLVKEIVSFIEK